MTKRIENGNQAVNIIANQETGPFHARVYVNTRNGHIGDATSVCRSFKTLAGAEKWATKQLAAA